MEWVTETDIGAYADRVLPWLERDPVWNTVPATVLVTRRDGTIGADRPWLAWLADEHGAVAGAALRTPPRGLLLPALPAGAVASLAAAAEPGLSGASGPAGVVAQFAAAYAARAGATARRGARQRLFELTELRLPADVPGQPRAAAEPDVDLCTDWLDEFAAAAGVPADRDRAAAARAVAQGRLLLWEVAGAPVAMAGNSPTVRDVTRIGPVFTPPEHRRHGYGAAVTGELARRLRQRGRVVLFADRANPSAVGVYQRLGFRPVGDWDDWRLEY